MKSSFTLTVLVTENGSHTLLLCCVALCASPCCCPGWFVLLGGSPSSSLTLSLYVTCLDLSTMFQSKLNKIYLLFLFFSLNFFLSSHSHLLFSPGPLFVLTLSVWQGSTESCNNAEEEDMKGRKGSCPIFTYSACFVWITLSYPHQLGRNDKTLSLNWTAACLLCCVLKPLSSFVPQQRALGFEIWEILFSEEHHRRDKCCI